jgi:hypothetical protein
MKAASQVFDGSGSARIRRPTATVPSAVWMLIHTRSTNGAGIL